jgi:hypothetical protein
LCVISMEGNFYNVLFLSNGVSSFLSLFVKTTKNDRKTIFPQAAIKYSNSIRKFG